MEEQKETHKEKPSYSQIKRAVMTCEIDKESQECKRRLKEINVKEGYE